MGRVTGKVAVVSGAARGQGRSHARMLAAEGADIIAVDLCEDIETNEYPLARPEDLDETARLVEKEGQRVHTEIADVRDRAALSAAVDRGVAELGHLDIVVANAGICPLTAGLPPQAFADAVDVDLGGVLNLVHSSLKHLESGASIIVIGSNAAFMSGLSAGETAGTPERIWARTTSPTFGAKDFQSAELSRATVTSWPSKRTAITPGSAKSLAASGASAALSLFQK